MSKQELNLGPLEPFIGMRLRCVHDFCSREFAAVSSTGGMHPGVATCLPLIAANPGISQIALALASGFDKATMVTIADDMERAGWVTRGRSPNDRRVYALTATAEGEKALKRLLADIAQTEEKVFGGLTASERRTLRTLINKLYQQAIVARAQGSTQS
jgi:DNA-binding MarR family transcriptional regulator